MKLKIFKTLAKYQSDTALQNKTRLVKQRLEELKQSHIDHECATFIRNIASAHPRRRVSMTIKQFRRNTTKECPQTHPNRTMGNELRNSCLGNKPTDIEENDL